MVKIIGAKAHAARMKRIVGPEMTRQVNAALAAGASALEVEAVNSITTGSSSMGRHVPSAPGEPPNNDLGTLVGNIETEKVDDLAYRVVSSAPYAAALEYGTSKMAERPYMRPAAAKTRDEITQLVRQAVKKVVSDGGKVVS